MLVVIGLHGVDILHRILISHVQEYCMNWNPNMISQHPITKKNFMSPLLHISVYFGIIFAIAPTTVALRIKDANSVVITVIKDVACILVCVCVCVCVCRQ